MFAITTVLAATTGALSAAAVAATVRLRWLRIALGSARCEARTDELTGIGNRRAFTTTLHGAISALPGRVAVVLLDLDRFKHINDSYGHPAGDHVLREVAGRLCRLDPRVRLAARLGGDEFALIVAGEPGTGIAVARLAWQAICHTPVEIGPHRVAVFACAGTATHQPGLSASDLLRRADIALYHAKHTSPVAGYPTGPPHTSQPS